MAPSLPCSNEYPDSEQLPTVTVGTSSHLQSLKKEALAKENAMRQSSSPTAGSLSACPGCYRGEGGGGSGGEAGGVVSGGGAAGGGRGCAYVMHGRSRMTVSSLLA